MASFSIQSDSNKFEYQAGQWSLTIDTASGMINDRNIQTAITGPKAGEPIEAFFTFTKTPGANYDAGKIVQEPDLAYPITVREPIIKDGFFQFSAQGEMLTTIAAKRLVGFILLDSDGEKILGRGSWSNLAIFSKKDYEFDTERNVLRIEQDYYRLIQTIEADKNRLDGVAGTFVKIDQKSALDATPELVVNFELGLVASILIPTNADQILALRKLKNRD